MIIKGQNRFNLIIYICLFLFQSAAISAKPFSQKRIISVDEAFKVSLSSLNSLLTISFEINKDSYLYSEQLVITSNDNPLLYKIIGLSEHIEDEFYGSSKVYENDLSIQMDSENFEDEKVLFLNYQGCLKDIICYSKQKKKIFFKRDKNKLISFKFL
jgi:thiol:disulfide interchange protein DsbD